MKNLFCLILSFFINILPKNCVAFSKIVILNECRLTCKYLIFYFQLNLIKNKKSLGCVFVIFFKITLPEIYLASNFL